MDEETRSESDDISLDLSYTSSEYDIESSDDGNSNSEEKRSHLGVLPYQFEPYASDSDDDEDDEHDGTSDDTSTRLLSLEWCQCEVCTIMPTALECVCCAENDHVQGKIAQYHEKTGKQPRCITQHPGFRTVCLDEDVLETAYSHYRQQYGQQIHNMNERLRYTGYRQFVRWIWGVLGREIRVVIPSCAVKKIREEFPSQDQTYHGFEYAQ